MNIKQAARYSEADGYKIVTAIADMTVNPAETTKAVEEAVKTLPVMEQANGVRLKIKAQIERAKAAATEAEQAQKDKDPKRYEAANKEWQAATARIQDIEQQLGEANAKIEAEKARLFYEKAVYFPAAANEMPLTDEEAEELRETFAGIEERKKELRERLADDNITDAAAAGLRRKIDALEHTKVTLSGETVIDLRGKEYYSQNNGKWEKRKIDRIGEDLPADGVRTDDLTAEQREEIAEQEEADRIAAMTPERRAEREISRINAKLDDIDRKSARTARAIALAVSKGGTPDSGDVEYLECYENQAAVLREERAALLPAKAAG